MTRVRFFEGQLLTAKDLADEQEYHLEKRRLHNRKLHGTGIVDGLEVAVENGIAPTIAVSPGLAIDRRGNEILVERLTRSEIGLRTDDTCFVSIEYTETPSDPVPGASAVGDVAFSRVTEGFQITITDADPAEDT